MTFTEDFLARDGGRSSRPSTPTRSRRWPTGIAAVRERGGRLFILGVGGSAGLGQPRGQRLPQDLRRRVLLPHRQRLRADRPGQRRGLGHHVRRVAEGLAARRRRRRAGLLGRRRQRREERLDQHRGRARRSPRSAAPRSSASSAATAATPPQLADACVIVPPTVRRPHHPAHRGAVLRDLAPAGQPPRARRSPRPSGSPSYDATRLRSASASSAAPASSAATSSRGCSSDPAHRAGHRLRQLLLRPRLAPRARSRTTRG